MVSKAKIIQLVRIFFIWIKFLKTIDVEHSNEIVDDGKFMIQFNLKLVKKQISIFINQLFQIVFFS